MQNPDKLRMYALPFFMFGLALMAFGMNGKKDVFLYAGIGCILVGLAFLKASVWDKPKESRRRFSKDGTPQQE